ncbi:MAG: hypothetical protein UU21_C0014G0007 [Candidatus Levybacteria bacterium GW2011_GWA2_40_8]|nr:MAG: hypothetical protein UU21_C0014G0007 [Candidatus Levybacteria bacterium GW2011_GWA2_40_8]
MKNEKCSQADHLWSCRQDSGMLGEKSTFTPLSEGQVALVLRDAARAEEVCPGGAIVCGTCDTPLIAEGAPSSPIDFQALKGNLVKPPENPS